VARAIQASDRDDWPTRNKKIGECAVDETGKQSVNGNVDEAAAALSIDQPAGSSLVAKRDAHTIANKKGTKT